MIADTTDTIRYNAWISGRSYQEEDYPTLDSIKFRLSHKYYQTNTTTIIEKTKPQKRSIIHIQPQAGLGYGITKKEFDVYVGLGIGVDL